LESLLLLKFSGVITENSLFVGFDDAHPTIVITIKTINAYFILMFFLKIKKIILPN
jgi:hypothetical protein